MNFFHYTLVLALSATTLPGCGSDSATPAMASNTTPSDGMSSTGSAQLPPTTNGADVEAWLKKGSYLDWSCETAEHPKIKVSAHGHNRVCSNDLIAGFSGAVGDERPKGSAAVKELYDDSSALVGYAVSVKLADLSSGGDNWYWYERTASGVAADGTGKAGAPHTICVSCHSGAGADTDLHNVNHSSDFVYDVVN